MTQNIIAEYYHSSEPNKYVRSEKTGWYEYNKYNVLVPKGMKEPDSLLNNLSKKLQDVFIVERNKLVQPTMDIYTNTDTFKEDTQRYKRDFKIYESAFKI